MSTGGRDVWIHRYGLKPRGGGPWNSLTRRRVLEGFLIRTEDGYGCAHPWPELGDAGLSAQFAALREGRRTPLLERALVCAEEDGRARREGRSLWEGLTIPPSHATVTEIGADFPALRAEGFHTVKLKGGPDWRPVLEEAVRARAAGLLVRVDFNGALTEDAFTEFAAAAREEGVIFDFVEDPVPPDAEVWERLRHLTGIPLACDRGGLAEGFDIRVVKPALEPPPARGGPPVVFTSYMDHPVGQLFAALESSRYGGAQLEAGLLTHRLLEDDAFTEQLCAAGPFLTPPAGTGLGFDGLLEALPWEKVCGSRPVPRGAGTVMQNPRAPMTTDPPPIRADQVAFLTSGSSGEASVVVHTAESLEASARAVNEWLGLAAEDVWMRALPDFHVGGYQISVRAGLAGARVAEFAGRWDARRFAEEAAREEATLTSLVPAQIFDLVTAGLRAPGGLRLVLAGGGALDADLAARVANLGWPVCAGYGMTEAASTIVAAAPGETRLSPLPGWRVRIREADGGGAGVLEISGPALCQGRYERVSGEWVWRPAGEWWRTSDLARLTADGRLELLGRADRVVKILGELVSLDAVERALESAGLAPCSFAVEALPDPRSGNRLVLATLSPDAEVLEKYETSTAPFARLSETVLMELPLSPLGKVRRAALREALLRRADPE